MAWFADLAGKAESLLNNLDEQTGAALRNHNVTRKKHDVNIVDFGATVTTDTPWLPKKRPVSRKKTNPIPDTKVIYSPNRQSSPTQHQARSQVKDADSSRNGSVKSKRSPTRRTSSPHQPYNLHNCPKTLVGDVKDNDVAIADHYGLKQRRFSLPSDLELLNNEDWSYKLQNLEVENAMLKNELNVMNREVAELLDRLRRTEDELTKTRIKMEGTEVLNHRVNLDKQSLVSQVELLKLKIKEHTTSEIARYKDQKQMLDTENNILKNRNTELEQRNKEILEQLKERETVQTKLESDLKHAQTTISDLQSNLQKTAEECRRLEKDWESYKVRVKNMLLSKDTEIKTLQEGLNVTEDTKILMEQIENLKEERDELSEAIAVVRSESSDIRTYLQQVEARHSAAERVVAALRDALRDERAARNRADAQCLAVAKEMKAMQMETGQTLASLRSQLRDKENELHNLRETNSCARTTDTSALNVADYDVILQDSIDSSKISQLTQTLVQRQAKIDHLLGENNMLRIQLEKLESKFKADLALLRANTNSVVHLQEAESRNRRTYSATSSSLSKLPMRLGLGMVKRYPVVWVLIIVYMVGLHFWVLTVLCTSTPENYSPSSKS